MAKPSDHPRSVEDWQRLRAKVLGLGRQSFRKSYYPELQRRLQELERFQALLDVSNEAFFIVEIPSGRIVDANISAQHQTGLEKEALLASRLSDIFPRETWKRLESFFASPPAYAGASAHFATSTKLKKGDEEWLPVLVNVTIRRFDEGASAIVVARDLSDQQRMEAQLRQAQRMEALGRLAGGVAHDFNNLLGALFGYSELIMMKLSESDPLREDLEQVLAIGERAAGLTRQLLAFSRQQVVQPKTIDLSVVVTNLRRMLIRVIGEDIQLVTKVSEEPALVFVDPGQMEQVIVNLVVNARDAIPEGGRLELRTSIAFVESTEGAYEVIPPPRRECVELSVIDTGIGINAATMERMCEPFFTTKSVGKGTGLGLSTAYGIIEQAGGGLIVESEVGQGTTFTILLPLVKGTPTEESAQRGLDTLKRHERLLIVEDDSTLRDILSRLLSSEGYDVLAASNGHEAIALLDQHGEAIDLVLTDVVMPGIKGPEVVAHLRQTRPHAKVIYMSGYLDDAVQALTRVDRREPLLAKPFSLRDLARMIRATLDSQGGDDD